jgi:hypothetical protein
MCVVFYNPDLGFYQLYFLALQRFESQNLMAALHWVVACHIILLDTKTPLDSLKLEHPLLNHNVIGKNHSVALA